MTNQPFHFHDSDRGSARHYHVQDRDGSNSASRFANEPPTYNRTTSHGFQPSQIQASRTDHDLNGYHDQGEDSDADTDWSGRLQNRRYDYAPHGTQNYQAIPRPWQSINPEVHRVLHDPALAEATARLEGRRHRHNRSSARQQQPRLADHHRREDHSLDPYLNSVPFGYSNLRNLNRDRPRTHATARWLDESQRAGPFDNIEQVGGNSEYDRRASYQPPGGYEQYQQHEVNNEYDERSSGTLY